MSYIFENFGEFIMQCQVTDGEFTAAVRWHVTTEEFYINTYTPDSLALIFRRNTEIDFSLGVRSIDGVEPNYRWVLTDRNRRQNDIGEEAETSYNFDLKGDYDLEGRVYHQDIEHSVFWQITVNSVLAAT